MKVILLDKVANLGGVGAEVSVKAGYARNFLLPRKLAVLATKENRAVFEQQRAELEKAAAAKLAAAKALAEKVAALGTLEVAVSAGAEGRLHGAVTAADLVDLLAANGVSVAKSAVRIPSGVLREVGEFEVNLHLHADVDQALNVVVVARS